MSACSKMLGYLPTRAVKDEEQWHRWNESRANLEAPSDATGPIHSQIRAPSSAFRHHEQGRYSCNARVWGDKQKNAESHADLICGKLQALYWVIDTPPAMNRSRCFLELTQEKPLLSRWESLWAFGVSGLLSMTN